jgi:hypothetical protein
VKIASGEKDVTPYNFLKEHWKYSGSIYGQFHYLESPHGSKENIRARFASCHFWIIPSDNMMHKGKHFLVVLYLHGKVMFMGSASHKNKRPFLIFNLIRAKKH